MVDENALQEDVRRPWQVLAVLCLVQLVVGLDQAFVMVALPSIERDLGFAAGDVQWVVTAYAVAFGGAVLLGGRVADVFGRRRTLLAGLALFALGAACAGLAPDAGTLVASRALQGLGVASAAPAAISTLTTTFVARRERSVALGIWASVGGFGTAVGLVVGGLVTDTVGWGWIGAIDVTVVALAIALGASRLPAGLRHRRSLDLPGAALVSTGLAAAVLAVSRVAPDGWGAGSTLAAAGLAVVLLGAFLLVEQRVDDPLLPLGLVRAPCVSAANIVAVLVAASVGSMMLLLTLVSQRVLGYTPGRAGIALLALSATVAIWALVAARLVVRTGPRALTASGLVLLTVALASFARMPEEATYARDLLPGLLLAAMGMAFAFVGLNTAALATVPAKHAGLGSGLLGTSQQVGGALGVAVLSSIVAAHGSAAAPAAAPALAAGLGIAFWVDAAIALVAVGAALVLLGRADCATAPVTAGAPAAAAA